MKKQSKINKKQHLISEPEWVKSGERQEQKWNKGKTNTCKTKHSIWLHSQEIPSKNSKTPWTSPYIDKSKKTYNLKH